MALVERRASTLAEIFSAVGDIREKWNPGGRKDQDLWFRGQGQRKYRLLPGGYRPEVKKYKYDEFTLLTRFRNLGGVHAPHQISSPWDWYFLAQHYRLPTRLLDWTESLLAGLYFAVAGSVEHMERKEFDSLLNKGRRPPVYNGLSPAMWILDAGSLNDWAAKEDGIFAPDNHDICAYCWDKIFDPPTKVAKPILPIAISPPRLNPRILAQQGMFTVHGTNDHSIDDLAVRKDPRKKIQLACIHVDGANLPFLWQELELAGCGRLSLFPDLDNVAAHLRWAYQSY